MNRLKLKLYIDDFSETPYKLEHLQWTAKKIIFFLGGGKEFWNSLKVYICKIIAFLTFWDVSKIYQVMLKRSMPISVNILKSSHVISPEFLRPI